MRPEQRYLIASLGAAGLLVGPRRTRPLAGFVFGLGLSRAHGEIAYVTQRAVLDLHKVIENLFDERRALTPRVDRLEETLRRFDFPTFQTNHEET